MSAAEYGPQTKLKRKENFSYEFGNMLKKKN